MWKGQLRLSLVTFGVRLYAATESSNRVSMNQLHKGCHQRIKNQTVCPIHGPVSRDEIVKGYEYEKDTYVIIDQEDLDALKLESNKVIDLVQFVGEGEIDMMFVDSPYFLGPDGPVAEEAFGVIREALKRTKKVGIGKLVMSGRERIVALHPEGKGFVLTTLRYAGEVRSASTYFDDIKDAKAEKEQIELAESIIKSKSKKFDPSAFADQYRDAFFEMVKQKVKGEKPVIVEEEDVPASYNFMDALKRSVEQVESGAGARAPSSKKAAGKKKAATSKKKPAKKPAAKSVPGGTKKKSKRA
jgi:DNA end-binding protein Ku